MNALQTFLSPASEQYQTIRTNALVHSKLSDMQNLVSTIAHHWRQPLTHLSFMLQDLPDIIAQEGSDSQELRDQLKEAMGLIQKMSLTINRFATHFHPSKEPVAFDMVTLVRRRTTLMHPELSTLGIELHFHDLCDRPHTLEGRLPIAYGYPEELGLVLDQVITNAKEAITANVPQTGVIDISLHCTDSAILLHIGDNGGGVQRVPVETIFDLYYSTKHGSNSGIGLFWAKRFVESYMHGSLTAANGQKGLIVTLRLPLSAD